MSDAPQDTRESEDANAPSPRSEFLFKLTVALIAIATVVGVSGYLYLRYATLGPMAEQTIEGSMPAGPKLRVTNDTGLLRVVGADTDEVTFRGTKIIQTSTVQSSEDALEAIQLITSHDQGGGLLQLIYPDGGPALQKTDIEIRAPRDTQLLIEGKNANIWIENITAAVQIKSEDAPNITVTGCTGKIDIGARDAEIFAYVPAEAESASLTARNGVVRVVLYGEDPAPFTSNVEDGTFTLTIDEEAYPGIRIEGEGMILDTTAAKDVPADQIPRPALLRAKDPQAEPGAQLSIGKAQLTLETGKPKAPSTP
ncbi:MAG: hypothetical protein H6684_09885 [Deltaproteobacteria bacterium]|nr:hypothetical protein [Deltaproteobacteria bacterium]